MSNLTSSYLNHLPALYRDDPVLGRFLLAFEQLLTGLPTDQLTEDNPHRSQLSLETLIDQVYTYLRPVPPTDRNPSEAAEFLRWLSGWVAFSLREDWDEVTKQRFVAQIVPLYRWRGTKKGLKQLLQLYTQENVEIYEFDQPRHFFQVELSLSNRSNLAKKQAIARALIDREKPAHTYYSLQFLFPTMRLIHTPAKEQSGLRIHVTTRLGTEN